MASSNFSIFISSLMNFYKRVVNLTWFSKLKCSILTIQWSSFFGSLMHLYMKLWISCHFVSSWQKKSWSDLGKLLLRFLYMEIIPTKCFYVSRYNISPGLYTILLKSLFELSIDWSDTIIEISSWVPLISSNMRRISHSLLNLKVWSNTSYCDMNSLSIS